MSGLDTLVVERHVLQPGGDVDLDVRVRGPLADAAIARLVELGGTVDGDDVVVARTWTPQMTPTDPRAAMRQMLTTELAAVAAADAGPIAISEPSEIL